jgi:putative Mg2+ transporter-C (MgtC) family protein
MMEWLQQFWQGLAGDFLDVPDGVQVAQIVGRTLVAAVLGGVLGYEREQKGKAAGLRTHILVTLAAAFFVIIPQQAGMSKEDLSRVIQGLAAGVGFLGAGAIIKQSEQGQVQGLTTAAGLYFTTAIGIAAGMGREVTAILGTGIALAVMTVLYRAEQWIHGRTSDGQDVLPPNQGKQEEKKNRAENTRD